MLVLTNTFNNIILHICETFSSSASFLQSFVFSYVAARNLEYFFPITVSPLMSLNILSLLLMMSPWRGRRGLQKHYPSYTRYVHFISRQDGRNKLSVFEGRVTYFRCFMSQSTRAEENFTSALSTPREIYLRVLCLRINDKSSIR